jgi:hypothetical protein
MSEMKKREVSGAVLLPSESSAQSVVRFLLEGKLRVQVTIDGKTYNGCVHNLDFALGSGADYVYASVHIPELDEQEGAEDYSMIRVAIHLDERVTVLKDAQDA